jgi:hypothetical protein
MFSQNLFDALCQTPNASPEPNPGQLDEAAMMQAIERAMNTYQRLFTAGEQSR